MTQPTEDAFHLADVKRVAAIIRKFPWHNFGLDEVGEIPARDAGYATALAERIVRALRAGEAS